MQNAPSVPCLASSSMKGHVDVSQVDTAMFRHVKGGLLTGRWANLEGDRPWAERCGEQDLSSAMAAFFAAARTLMMLSSVFFFFFFILPACVFAHQKRASDLTIAGCESSCRCWELSSAPLEEPTVLFTSQPPLQAP